MRPPIARAERVYLAVPAVAAFSLDILLTVLGQPANYWAGDRGGANEANPLAAYLLAIHPAAFLGAAVLYAALFTAGIYLFPRPVAWWLSIGLLLAHAGGARTWIWHFSEHFSLWDGILNSAMAVLGAYCFLKASRRAGPDDARTGEPSSW